MYVWTYMYIFHYMVIPVITIIHTYLHSGWWWFNLLRVCKKNLKCDLPHCVFNFVKEKPHIVGICVRICGSAERVHLFVLGFTDVVVHAAGQHGHVEEKFGGGIFFMELFNHGERTWTKIRGAWFKVGHSKSIFGTFSNILKREKPKTF